MCNVARFPLSWIFLNTAMHLCQRRKLGQKNGVPWADPLNFVNRRRWPVRSVLMSFRHETKADLSRPWHESRDTVDLWHLKCPQRQLFQDWAEMRQMKVDLHPFSCSWTSSSDCGSVAVQLIHKYKLHHTTTAYKWQWTVVRSMCWVI